MKETGVTSGILQKNYYCKIQSLYIFRIFLEKI